VPLVVGESGFVSGDFHRLKSATANESRKKSQSNQGFYAFFFFQTGSKGLATKTEAEKWFSVMPAKQPDK
jgi:hypothetical protein